LPAVQRQSSPHLQLAQLPSARQPQFDPGVQGQAPGAQVQVDLAATFAAAWVSHLQPAVQRLPAVQRQSSPHLQLAQLPSARQPQFDPGVQGHAPGWHEHDAFATVAALATAPHAALQHSPSVQSHAPGGQVQFAQQAPAVFDSAPPRGATVRKANPANANTPEAISLVNMAYLHLLSGNTEIRWRCGQNAPDQPPWLFNTDNVLNSQRRRWINRARSPARPAGDCGCREGVRLKDAQATPRSPHRQKRPLRYSPPQPRPTATRVEAEWTRSARGRSADRSVDDRCRPVQKPPHSKRPSPAGLRSRTHRSSLPVPARSNRHRSQPPRTGSSTAWHRAAPRAAPRRG
jgi:hypothetical protein